VDKEIAPPFREFTEYENKAESLSEIFPLMVDKEIAPPLPEPDEYKRE
jgi:hypothetical protein